MVTTSTWPSQQYWPDLALELGYDAATVLADGPEAAGIRESIQQEFVKADIYFQTLNIQTIEQTAKYAVSSSTFCALSKRNVSYYL